MFLTGFTSPFTQCLSFFPLWITYFVFVHSFWFYFIIDEVYVFRWNWHRLRGLSYNFSISNDLTQMVNFPTQIPDCDSHSPALLDLFLSSDASICSTMAFPPLGNSDHVIVSVSIDFPSNSQGDVPFHRIMIIWEMFHGRISLKSVLLLLQVNFVSGFRLGLQGIIQEINLDISSHVSITLWCKLL